MPSQELINYISTSRKTGVNDDTLRLILHESGWTDEVISAALAAAPQSRRFFKLPIDGLFLNKILARFFHNKLKIAGVVAVLFFSGTAFAAYQYYHSPNVLMKRMVGNVQSIKTVHFSFVSSNSIVSDNTQLPTNTDSKTSENISGDVDLSDSKNPKFNILADINESDFDSNTLDVNAKIMYVKSKLYFNFMKLLFGSDTQNMSSLENTWYFLDQSTLKNPTSLYPDTFSTSSVTTKTQNTSLEQTILQNVTDSKKRELIQAALKYKIFTTTKKPDEKINGVNTYHLHYVINQDQAIAFLMEYDKINQTKNPTPKAEWTKIFQGLSKENLLQGDVWIGKSDLYPYKLALSMHEGSETIGKTVIIPVTITMSNFNKPVTITPPANVTDAAPIIKSFLQQELGGLSNEGGLGVNENTGQLTNPHEHEEGYPILTPTPTSSDFVGDGHLPVLGSKNAKVTMVEFGDLRGPFAKQFEEEVLPEIKKNYIDTGKVQFYFRNYVLLGNASLIAANADECANEQGKFWNFYTYMYENQPNESDTSMYTVDNLSKIAGNMGMNATPFRSCLSTDKYNTNVTTDYNEANNVGVNGSPTFYINGVQLVGAQLYNVYQEQIDTALNGSQ